MTKQIRFFSLLIAAIIITYVPIIGLPLNWLETYFHEISHALATVFTAGTVTSLHLYLNGSGLCFSQGGWSTLIAFSGYAGASLWGAAILVISAKPKFAKWVCSLILVLLVVSLLLWVRDLLTAIIVIGFVALFGFSMRFPSNRWLALAMQLVGMTVLLNAIKSPLYLLLTHKRGDAFMLSQLTYVPALVWIVMWFSISLVLLWYCWKQLTRS
ncbi:M50 family metallopeptidase [Paraferrimonas haliotis]|uniref:Membrane zinc metalloprotease n=1 Tax=Paraferrimonas haliotis TaxID=2013866 RepID=A0AA37TUI3_9GAMM|nr:M50 family metallopeptidase [Paraferrimonas haliotis]GLS84747.1 membrane zinc metalloprotease [Paraferrimonas haliotis]